MVLTELSMKDVVNDEDGIKLGRIIDLDIDIATGRVISITIDRGFRLSSIFTNKNQITIPWSKIIKIGNDVIIVEHIK